MKVTFRTVSGESFTLDAEEGTTVAQLKGAVEEARSIPKETLKLVCKCVKSPDHPRKRGSRSRTSDSRIGSRPRTGLGPSRCRMHSAALSPRCQIQGHASAWRCR